MDWLEITLNTEPARLDELTALLTEAGYEGLVIEDESDFQEFLKHNEKYWDYVDEDLLAEKRGLCRIKLYLGDDAEGRAQLARLRTLLEDVGFPSRPEAQPLKSEDWENGYKQYYKPTEIGEKLLILPLWEQLPETDRAILKLDPGISFGTGGHATTRLCLELMEQVVRTGDSVLDLGCGSGILAIGALLLGAGEALGCDIDPLSKDIAAANAAENGLFPPRCVFACGDVLGDTRLKDSYAQKKFDLVLANIVADVIIPLSAFVSRFLRPEAHFICSGIIGSRGDEVAEALEANGLSLLQRRQEDDWCAFLCRMRRN